MIHLQLVEGLHVAALNDLEKLKEFEKSKLKELTIFALDNEGKETFIKKLKTRLDKFALTQLESNLGVAPFNFGKKMDYWPEMIEINTPIDKKIDYLSERDKAEENFLREKKEADDERVNHLI